MIALFPHNEAAYEAAEFMLVESGKAAVIHPTGTGKSLIGFKLCETHSDSVICWLSPSFYIFKTQLENLRKIADGWTPENIVFLTYAKLSMLTETEMAEIHPDYIILDEFHRVGAEVWGEGVRTFLTAFPKAKILGLSATHIRYLDNQRDMADELFEGNIASEMTLGEAIVRGILNPPKYVLSVFSYQQDLEKYHRRVKNAKSQSVRDAGEQYLEALRRALEKADGLDEIFARHMKQAGGKYLVFCANAEHMREMITKAPAWFSKVDAKPHIYSAYSDDPETSRAFADFKSDESEHLKLLYCIDMLNEGIHIDDIDGVILLRPTVSPIVYKQQIGRALSAGKQNEPLIFDIVNNIENLYSISSVQQEMKMALDYYLDQGEREEIVNESFLVIDEVADCRRLFDKLNDTLEASWDIMFEYAKAYAAKNGNLDINRRYKTEAGYSLGSWIHTQRRVYNGLIPGHLSEERIERLNAIGMVWQMRGDLSWERNFQALQNYYRQFGNIDVKSDYVTDNGICLGSWITNLRTWYSGVVKSRYLSDERVEALNRMGMIWDKFDYLFERNYEAAVAYYKEHGDLDVPSSYVSPKTGVRLGSWIHNLRTKYRKNPDSIRPEQKIRLDALEMEWENKYVRLWNQGYKEAKDYYNRHGNLNVERTYRSPRGFDLIGWLANRRDEYQAGKLSEERIQALNDIGMVFEKEDPWDKRYSMAEAYSREHGSVRSMTADYQCDGIWLGKWLNEQKQIYRGKRKGKMLSEDQIQKLNALGIEWETPASAVWNRYYEQACAYYDKHGTLKLSRVEDPALYRWWKKQGNAYEKGSLTDVQKHALEKIGIHQAGVPQ